LFRQLVLPFARHFGIRPTLIVGIAIGALAYIPIGYVRDAGPTLVLFLLLLGLGDAFYWACFHATSAKLGDVEARGAQVSAVQVVYSMSNIIGPLLGGFLQVTAGPIVAFLFAGMMRLLSIWPLLITPNTKIDLAAKIDDKSKRFAAQVYFFDGFGNACAGNAFTLALFITLGENFQSFGFALAGAAMLGAVMGLGIGRMFDLGHFKWSTAIGMCAVGLFMIVAALGYHNPLTAVSALALGAVAGPLYAAPYNARVYNLSKASGDALRFQIWGEGGWDTGCALGSCLAALLIYEGFSFTWPIAIGLIGTAGVWFTLHQTYQTGEPSLRK
ncbi:MAG: MFS transporter, partial [Aestuariivirga sp.]